MPSSEEYRQDGAKFDVEKRVEESTSIWHEKTASYEI